MAAICNECGNGMTEDLVCLMCECDRLRDLNKIAHKAIDQLREQVRELEHLRDGLMSGIERQEHELTKAREAISRVVTLCGSTKFKDEFLVAQKRLTLEGWIVLSVGMFGHADSEDITTEQKTELDALHFQKIDISARSHFINKNGYIGKSTGRELEYSKQQGKIITYEFPQALAELEVNDV